MNPTIRINITRRLMYGVCISLCAANILAHDQNTPQDSPTLDHVRPVTKAPIASVETINITSPTVLEPTGRTDAQLSDSAEKFAVNAAVSGQKEVKLGQMALQKSQNSGIKEFAQKMIDDHSRANQDLQAIAQRKGIKLPDAIIFSTLPKTSSYSDSAVLEQQDSDQIAGVTGNRSAMGNPDLTVQGRQAESMTQTDSSKTYSSDVTAWQSQPAETGNKSLFGNPDPTVQGRDAEALKRRTEPGSWSRSETAGGQGYSLTGREAGSLTNAAKAKAETEAGECVQKLDRLSGSEFDRAYVQEMLNDHKSNVREYEQASISLDDADLKSFASQKLPTLREHLQHTERLARAQGVISTK